MNKKSDNDIKIEINTKILKKRINDIFLLEKTEGNFDFPSLFLDDFIDFLFSNECIKEVE